MVHEQPVWQDRSNFIIHAELVEDAHIRRYEQLFVRQMSDDHFEVCCIPFFIYDIAVGDVVSTAPKGDRKYVVEGVAVPSGRYVFRAWFGDTSYPPERIADELTALGSLVELSSRDLLAIDAVDAEHAQRVADFLAEREQSGLLVYETGRS